MKEDYKLLLNLLKPHKKTLFFIILLSVLTAGLKSSVPEIMRILTDKGWSQGDRDLSFVLPLLIAIIWVLVNVLRFINYYFMRYVSEVISLHLRRDLMNKYLDLNVGYLQKFISGTGGLMSRMINDINVIQIGIVKISDLIREPITSMIIFCYLLYIDWVLLAFLMIAMPLILIIVKNLSRSLRKYGHRSMESMEDLTSTMKESLDGTRTVQSFNLQGTMRERFSVQADELLKHKSKIIAREELAGPVSESLTMFAVGGILIYIGHQIFKKQLSIADFMAFSFALAMIGDSVKKIQTGFVCLQQSLVALRRYQNIIEQGESIVDPVNPLSFPEDWKFIQYNNVNFSYDEKPILSKINLKIKRGEVIALVGASGGGKSTLVNLLGRFFEPTQGEILIDNRPIHQIGLQEYRKNVALVSQDVFLFRDTIESNIHAGDFSKPKSQVVHAAKMANAHPFISNMTHGYKSMCGERGSLLSGGEKQRISIARAILKDAPILILDEATSALDNESEKEVQKGLSELMKGRTTFVIAHRLSTIENADRILVLKDGQVVEEGTHSELINAKGEYARLHSI